MADKVRWGPDNPHPLSKMRTELVWEGKYDEYGNRRPVDVAGSAMPLQKIETVDEPGSNASARDRTKGHGRSRTTAHSQMSFGEQETTLLDDFRNMLIWGGNKLVMASLLKEFKGKVDLIYIDPPFDVGADFTMQVPLGDEKDTVEKDQSLLEMVAYRDMWGKGTDSYLHMIYERLALMKELLKETGSIYIHLGPNISHYVKPIIDEVFGDDNYLNEIIWQRFTFHADAKRYGIVHDSILFYSKSESTTWNPQRKPLEDSYIESHFTQIDNDGRRYRLDNALAKGQGPARRFGDKVLEPPSGTHWRWGQEKIGSSLFRVGNFWIAIIGLNHANACHESCQ